MGDIVKFLFIIFLVYAFGGILSFFPFAFGIFYNIITFPLTFLNNNVYPVGNFPFLMLAGSCVALVGFFVIRLFNKE